MIQYQRNIRIGEIDIDVFPRKVIAITEKRTNLMEAYREMKIKHSLQIGLKGMGAAIIIAGSTCVVVAALTWYRFGRERSIRGKRKDSRLESFLPNYEVIECHSLAVSAPAKTTFAAAVDIDLERSILVRVLFKTRRLLFGSVSEREAGARLGLLQMAKLWGWGILNENPDREIVFGAVTQPWRAHPVFCALPAAEFTGFDEPGYVKIAWTLRVDPIDNAKSIAYTETRASTTDSISRAKFRLYWAFLKPGIVLIRLATLRLIKKTAERLVIKNTKE